jgi:ribosomal protein S18 acetylase RimI-like enzyme
MRSSDVALRVATPADAALLAKLGARTFRDTHDVLWLCVWGRNFRARAFYERWGFTEVGETSFVLGSDVQRDLVLSIPL